VWRLPCVTAENQASTWLNFEAGALAKSVEASRVVPLAIDLTPADIAIPLGQFQAQPATQEGFAALLVSINQHCDPPLSDTLLARSVSKWWPELDRALAEINAIATVVEQPHGRTDRELLEELLDTVRSIARTSEAAASATPTSTHDVLVNGRERLVLTQLARGQSTEEIAAELMLSRATVRTHINNLLRKFDVQSRRELLAVAEARESPSGDGLHP
jgi:DNA-binding CsgD family transcriptional regulator